jgi:hypothetical protein
VDCQFYASDRVALTAQPEDIRRLYVAHLTDCSGNLQSEVSGRTILKAEGIACDEQLAPGSVILHRQNEIDESI